MRQQQEREAAIAKKLSQRSRHHQHQYNNVITLQSAGAKCAAFGSSSVESSSPFLPVLVALGIHMVDYLNDTDAKAGIMYVSSVVR